MVQPPERRTDKDIWLRRIAVRIVDQLPENEEDALAVLDHAKTLQQSFLGRSRPS